jgi:C1A family cysteine protease
MALHYAMGWHRDLPDIRDYSPESAAIKKMFSSAKVKSPLKSAAKATTKVDLSRWCSPIDDQGDIGSCTAHAGVGLLEYFENRAFGRFLDASRLFLYKVTRNLLGWTGDTGGLLRTAMKAMVLFGIPPESYYAYDTKAYDKEPNAFLYSFASNFKSIQYYRLDPAGTSHSELLTRVRNSLAAGHPAMFGFTVYNFGNNKGEFAYPGPHDRAQGGHAILAVGYDDDRKIGSLKGALKIRNSWGTGWGEDGYGWLPYKYVESGLADDFWTLFKAEYVDTEQFA